MKANDSFASFALWKRIVYAAEKSIETNFGYDGPNVIRCYIGECAIVREKRHLTDELRFYYSKRLSTDAGHIFHIFPTGFCIVLNILKLLYRIISNDFPIFHWNFFAEHNSKC